MTSSVRTPGVLRGPALPLSAVGLVASFAYLADSSAGLLRYTLTFVVVIGIALAVGYLVSTRNDRSWVISITLLAVLVRVAFAVMPFLLNPDDPYLFGNARKFDRIAWGWVEAEGWFFNDYRFPGFLQFVIVLYKVFSPDIQRPLVPLLFVALAGGLSAPLTYRFAQILMGDRVARVAGLLVALHPEFVFHATTLIRDQLAALGLSMALYGLAMIVMKRPATGYSVSVLGIIIAMLINPSFGSATLFIVGSLLIARRARFVLGIASALVLGLVLIAFLNIVGPTLISPDQFGTAFTGRSIVTGDYFLVKYDSALAAELAHPTFRDASLARRIATDLPTAINLPFRAVWGGAFPMIAVGAYFDHLSRQIHLILRSVAWQLTLPFLFYGVFVALRGRRLSSQHKVLAMAALAVLIIPALATVADMWDGPRYRSFGAPVLASVMALGWVQGLSSRSPALKLFLLGGFVINLLYLARNSLVYGTLGGVTEALFSASPVRVFNAVVGVATNDFTAILVFVIFVLAFWYVLGRLSRRHSEV